ncbi:hypothetical protein [Streptomyces xanthophaeus]|uniref:hypothetical protein n=1 Tax=Streptomyces xanthophaeus TaxID=67385 RepID=UPI0026495D3A|nr:hypothetical protein [Streptomyces xanthophaeus]WKD30593.1 hypothetical protein KO717_00450 [Streptomyces xanthophaeus]
MTPRPTRAGIVRIWARSLTAVVLRRPTAPGPRHSAGMRQVVLVLAATEIVVAFLLSSMLPPAVRPVHAALELLLVLGGLGLVAALVRHSHEVAEERVVLRTAFLGDVTLPRASVRSTSHVVRTVPGRGPRPVPGEPDAVACSVESALNVAVHLDPPVRLDLGPAGPVEAATVYICVDSPPDLAAALRRVVPPHRS